MEIEDNGTEAYMVQIDSDSIDCRSLNHHWNIVGKMSSKALCG
jgi:hypothetical protein